MTDDDKMIDENWASDAWEAAVKGQSDGDMPPDADRLTDEEIQSHDVPLPPPTLVTLASGLAAQAMVSLGVFPNPATGKSAILLNQAAHLIDMIDLLYEKTTGNRTDEETKTLENALHELRMIYLSAQRERNKEGTSV